MEKEKKTNSKRGSIKGTKKRTIKKKTIEVKDIEKDKTQFSLVEVIIIMIICIVFGLLIGGYIVSQKAGRANEEHKIDFNEINGLYEDINKNYYGGYNSDSFRDNTIKGMLSYLDDPYARLITKEEAKKYAEELESEFIGIGLELSQQSLEELPKVTKVYDETPAKRKGIKVDDEINKVDGKDLSGMNLNEVIGLIKKGNRGDKVKLTIRRNEEIIDVTISKDLITIPTVNHRIISHNDKKIAEIIISNFSKNTYKEFKAVYEEISKEKVDGIIIDLRDNGGGYLTSASKITSLFLEKDKVIYIEKKKDKEEKISSNDDKVINEKVVIIIDHGTASGSEILASSLKNNLGVTLVGNTTYGKNTIQKIHNLKDNSIVKFTIGEWLTSEGTSLKDNPINPDITVEANTCYDLNGNNDPYVEQALKVFE